jgi:hypothetical protein
MAKNTNSTVDFTHFLEKFPKLELPVTLNDEAQHIFSKNNDPLPPLMVQQHILPLEANSPDEFTEFIPCFSIPQTYEFHAVVYWKAELMTYQYILVTFDKKGNFIDQKVLAGLYSDGSKVTQSVATIEPDWMIHVASGQVAAKNEKLYDASDSSAFELELLADGKIIHAV